jgi:hypothetical protein
MAGKLLIGGAGFAGAATGAGAGGELAARVAALLAGAAAGAWDAGATPLAGVRGPCGAGTGRLERPASGTAFFAATDLRAVSRTFADTGFRAAASFAEALFAKALFAEAFFAPFADPFAGFFFSGFFDAVVLGAAFFFGFAAAFARAAVAFFRATLLLLDRAGFPPGGLPVTTSGDDIGFQR